MNGKLKLSAVDADDLSVISAAVQDSLVAVRDCAFFAAESRFVLLLNRFRWEADATVETAYWRTHSALVFNAVRAVHHHKIPLQEPDRVLELLAVAQDAPGSVLLRFAGDLSHREVAAAMGVSEEAARRNAFEGLRKLRQEMT